MTGPARPDTAPWCEVLTADARGTRRLALSPAADGGFALSLGAPPGAEVVHCPIGRGERLWVRCELPPDADGRVRLSLHQGPDGRWRLDPAGAELRLLAPEAPPPPLPLPAPDGDQPWQVALLIDRTARWFVAEAQAPASARSGLLLADPVRWPPLFGRLRGLLSALAEPGPVQWALLAFADTPIPEVAAGDLRPPGPPGASPEPVSGERRFRPWPPRDDDGCRALTAVPGGDWVDALAEGLLAAGALPWSAAARRLVVLFGDSPGHALLHPLPTGADAQARANDVDLAAGLLYAAGIEVLTLWHRPPSAFAAAVAPAAQELIEATGAQYRRLATSPAHGLTAEDFEPAAVATWLRSRGTPLARGVSLGFPAAEPD